ncbi:MAG: glycogen/starch synthase [bacterium]|nr:glycogen/starch synthase [bacterium]
MNSPKILIVGYEVAPFYKRGGLGDVLGSLPIALAKQGVDVRVVMPDYDVIPKGRPKKAIGTFRIVFDTSEEEVTVHEGVLPNSHVGIYFLGNSKLISPINLKRKQIAEFLFFDLAVCGFVNWLEDKGGFVPELLHCHDWHTGLIPLILKKRMHSSLPTLLTIHNLGYQGRGSVSLLSKLSIEEEAVRNLDPQGTVGKLSSLGEGILHATALSTVSPTYAKEITSPMKRAPIFQYFRLREHIHPLHITGILNGIDTEIWNPRTDPFVFSRYDAHTVGTKKEKNRERLVHGLKLAQDRPIFSFVGRMAGQKGLNIIKQVIGELMELEINIVFLGSGDRRIEQDIRMLATRYPHFIHADIVYSEVVAHQIYSGSDFLLIPSLYEPCGLIQMLAMRYGTLPVASDTGGLHDSIDDGVTGFLFHKGSGASLIASVKRALAVYKDKKSFERMQATAMERDFSWDRSASAYKSLYGKLLASSV